jgi:hypothetical protein
MRAATTIKRKAQQPELFTLISMNYISLFYYLAGKDYDARINQIGKPIPGVAYQVGDEKGTASYPGYGNKNLTLCDDGLARALQGLAPSKDQVAALKAYSDWLILPANIRYYMSEFLTLGPRFDNPQSVIDDFDNLYDFMVHPELCNRFDALGIEPKDIQRTLREHPEINPAEIMYFLSGATGLCEVAADLNFVIAPAFSNFAQILLGPNLKPGEDAAEALFGFNESPNARAASLKNFTDREDMIDALGEYARGLPLECGPALKQKRRDVARRFFRHHAGLNPDAEDGLSEKELLTKAAASAGFGSMDFYLKLNYGSVTSGFLNLNMKMLERMKRHNWNEVKPDLRQRFEAAAIKGHEDIAQKILDLPGQEKIAQNVDIILHLSRGETGYSPEFHEVIQALLHPERALFAGGLLRDPFYVAMHELAGATPDFDAFWNVTRAEPKNAEQRLTVALHARLTEALKRDDELSGAVTNGQIAVLLGTSREQYIGLFERPYSTYFLARNEVEPQPSAAMRAIENRLGISLREEWTAIDNEKRGAVAAREHQAAIELAARREAAAAQPKATPDPWRGVAASVAAAIKTKFEAPGDLAAAIFQSIRSRTTLDERVAARLPGMIAQEVEQALRSKVAGVNSDNLPLDIMHAHILKAMEPNQRDVAKAIFESRSRAQGMDVHKQTVLANIVALAMQNPRLATFLNWRQLRNAHAKANVADLADNVFSAYTLRSQRDNTLRPRDSLAGIVETLNTGLQQAAHCSAEGIVPIDTWRAAARLRSGQDPLPKGATAHEFRLARE